MIIRFPSFVAVMVFSCFVATFPASGGQGADSPLLINELMAANATTIRDPQNQYDDWIELRNAGTQSVNVGGMYL
ncbi:MAG: hypothetical protein EHM35_11065, partial [Planctomycetaceae bacterium]